MNNKSAVDFSCKHPITILSILLGIIILTCISLKTVKQNFLPEIGDRFLLVSTHFNGVNASQMRKLVTVVIEDTLSSLQGVKNITSTTREGISLVCVELHWNIDSSLALAQCRSLLDGANQILPAECQKSEVSFFNPKLTSNFRIVMEMKDSDLSYAKYLADKEIKGNLQRIKGVASAKVFGGIEDEIHIVVDKSKAENFGLILDNIAQILSYANFDYPAGTITNGNKETVFKTYGLFESMEQIQNCPLLYVNNGIVRVKDIAYVESGYKEQKSFFCFNGKESICFDIYKKSDESPITLSREIKKQINKMNQMYKDNFTFTVIHDDSVQLKDSMKQLVISVFIGVLITMFVLLIFFHSLRLALLTSSIMPLTILFTILILQISGRSINILSVSGIALGIGMVVDSTIVVIESVLKKIDLGGTVKEGTEAVLLSSIGSALTTIIVFIPLFFLPGLIGRLFSDLAIAVISSIAFSCILSIFYVSAVLTLWDKRGYLNNITQLDISRIENFYKKSLERVFVIKIIVPLIFLGCIIISLFCIKSLKKELFSETLGDVVQAKIIYPSGTPLKRIKDDSFLLNQMILQNEYIKSVSIKGGLPEEDYESYYDTSCSPQMLLIFIKTSNQGKARDILNKIIKECGLEYQIINQKTLLENILNIEDKVFIVTENNPEQLDFIIEKSKEKYERIEPNLMEYEYDFKIDRFQCARFGLSAVEVAMVCRNALEGVYSSPFYKNGRTIPMLVKFKDGQINDIEELNNLSIPLKDEIVKFSSLGEIEPKENTKVFYRYNRKDAKKIVFKESVNPDNSFINPVAQEFNELFQSGILILIVVVLLLYCVMGAQFESFLIPLLLITALIPAFAGAFFALKICGLSININSIIALIILFGTSVNNSIILYESIITIEKNTIYNIVKLSVVKLRPILITTLTSIMALIPFSIDPFHKNSQQSMAVAIIGGLLFSLIVVLYVVPIILSKVIKKEVK